MNQNAQTTSTDGRAALKKHHMTVFGVVAFVFCSVCAGAFGIEEMIPAAAPGMTILLLLFVPLIWALPQSLIAAEMSSVLPGDGGLYHWTSETLGEFWAFIVGIMMGVGYYMSNAAYIVLVTGYLGFFFEFGRPVELALQLGLILFFTIINLLGIKEVSRISEIFTVLIIIGFVAVTIVGFANWSQNPFEPVQIAGQTTLQSIAGGIAICVWMYAGYGSIAAVSGEVSNPKVISKGLMICLPIVTLIYILPTIAGLASVGDWENWTIVGSAQGVGYSTVLTNYVAPWAGYAFLIIAIISQLSIFNAQIAAGSRAFFVLADDNYCPKVLRKVSKKRGVPWVGVLSYTIFTAFLVVSNLEFTTLILISVVPGFIQAGLMCVTCVKNRMDIPLKNRDPKKHFTIPFGKIGLGYCVLCIGMIAVFLNAINGIEFHIFGMFYMIALMLLYPIFRWVLGGKHKTDPVKYPINPKTKLAWGDLNRISIWMFLIGILGILGRVFLQWYQGDVGPEQYKEWYGDGFLGNFDAMLLALLIVGIVGLAGGVILNLVGKKIDKKPDDQHTTES